MVRPEYHYTKEDGGMCYPLYIVTTEGKKFIFDNTSGKIDFSVLEDYIGKEIVLNCNGIPMVHLLKSIELDANGVNALTVKDIDNDFIYITMTSEQKYELISELYAAYYDTVQDTKKFTPEFFYTVGLIREGRFPRELHQLCEYEPFVERAIPDLFGPLWRES
jgi:hypothetical protein